MQKGSVAVRGMWCHYWALHSFTTPHAHKESRAHSPHKPYLERAEDKGHSRLLGHRIVFPLLLKLLQEAIHRSVVPLDLPLLVHRKHLVTTPHGATPDSQLGECGTEGWFKGMGDARKTGGPCRVEQC